MASQASLAWEADAVAPTGSGEGPDGPPEHAESPDTATADKARGRMSFPRTWVRVIMPSTLFSPRCAAEAPNPELWITRDRSVRRVRADPPAVVVPEYPATRSGCPET